ncbi:DNA-binding transcriptional LysR family regulator [Nocardia transvalensis]|uniref:DNA-binding transcriptional LysR family regulator n=1 Tax=Nocardia transvalensis TaxID=37333 RepID=A0A7W9UM02_9NOCA|nr:LysR family transcriptional regulator [Nocardia transvalensis]MBB5917250.1 DNA-binding transcriptional LysR family regulator [Nocardia transvalensis]
MELREAEIFLVLAEEQHFGRTAQRLYLTQPRVSQTIRALEERIGGKLFDRTSRSVRLTALGERLRDELRPAHDQFRRAIATVTEMARGVSGDLRVCVASYAMAGPRFTAIVREFQARYPDCRLTVTEEFPGEFARLRTGVYHLMCHRLPIAEPDVTVGPILSREPSILLVPAGSALARRGHATLEDLGDHAVIPRGDIPKALYDRYFPAVTPGGRPIPRGAPIATTSDILHRIARGEVVHPTSASFVDYYHHPEVTHIPLAGNPPVEGALVWITAMENAAIRAFAGVAADICSPTAPVSRC